MLCSRLVFVVFAFAVILMFVFDGLCTLFVFVAALMVFFVLFVFLLPCSWFLLWVCTPWSVSCLFCCYVHCFLILLGFCCHARRFVMCLCTVVAFAAMRMDVFDFLCVFAGMLMVLLMCLHPLIMSLLCSCAFLFRMLICFLLVCAPLSKRLLKSSSPIN